MTRLIRFARVLFVASMLAAVVLAVTTAPAVARGICECANLDAPVICKGHKIYPNPCVAACFGATNCVPYGG